VCSYSLLATKCAPLRGRELDDQLWEAPKLAILRPDPPTVKPFAFMISQVSDNIQIDSAAESRYLDI